MRRYTVDTSTVIARKLSDLTGSFLFSSVVLMELLASASDDSERRLYESAYRAYEKDNSLIVPDPDDWLMASKVLYWLTQGRRKSSKGKAPKLKPGASQRMAMDVLLAVSAKRWNTTIITDNWNDFRSIQYYCDVKIAKVSNYFDAE
jgi:predicted nucleic acid-binding protein